MRRLVEDHELDPTAIEGTGKDGRLTKKDVLAHLEALSAPEPAPAPIQPPPASEPAPAPAPESTPTPEPAQPPAPEPAQPPAPEPAQPSSTPEPAPSPEPADSDLIRREPMSRLRQRIAEHLVAAQHNAAMLTTFNEIDMSAVIATQSQVQGALRPSPTAHRWG